MGGRPRTEGAKPPSAEGAGAPAKRSKGKAPAEAAASPKAKAKAKPAAASAEAPHKAKAKAAGSAPGPASASARAPGPARKAGAKSAEAVAAPVGAAEALPNAKAKKPAAGPAPSEGAPRKAKGSDAMALLDALRRAQGKPVTEVAPTGGEPEAEEDADDTDPEAAGERSPLAAEIPRIPKAPPPFARTSGAPALGFPADKRPAPRWDFAVGKPLTLSLGVRSTGGVGRGVIVELSGAAVADGLFEASELVHDATRARFVRDAATGVLRATLADSAIPIGVQVPLSPPPRDEMQRYAARTLLASTHVELSIEGRGSRTGTALLSVAARPATGSAAPLKWTRPITFR